MKLTIKRSRIRDNRFVPDPDAQEETLEAEELRSRLAPSNSPRARSVLASASPGAFIGIVKYEGGEPTNFVFYNPKNRRDASWIFEKRPEFAAGIQEVYEILKVERDGGITEC